MSKSFGLLSAVLSALLLSAAVPAAAGAASPPMAAVKVQHARFGMRSFGRRPAFAPRYRTRSPYSRSPYSRSYRRPRLFHGVFGGMLRLLGIAYLFHLFFGIGPGGSPLGLLLLVALIAFVA